jgi:hypothetical protein
VPQKDPGHNVDPDDQLTLARTLLHDPASVSTEDRALTDFTGALRTALGGR